MDIRLADKTNFHPHDLDAFDRYQKVNRIYRLVEGELTIVPSPFEETWSPARKRELENDILSGDYISYCAYVDGRVVGALLMLPELDHNRLIVDSFHVSLECRRQGIGRALFEAAKTEGRRRGASALYLSACSAEETINFYFAMGCELSANPIPECVEKEPCDLQLECKL